MICHGPLGYCFIWLQTCHFPVRMRLVGVWQWKWRWKFFLLKNHDKAVGSEVHRNTITVILRVFLFFAIHRRGFWRRRNFYRGFTEPIKLRMHVWLCSWAVEISNKIGFRPALGQRQSILCRFSANLHFGATGPDLSAFLLYLRTAFFEAHLLN